MYKRSLPLVLAISLILMSSAALAAQVVPGSSVELAFPGRNISLIPVEYDPYPAQPNQAVHLWIKVENFGQEPYENAIFKLMPEYPFSLPSGESGILKKGTITGGGTRILEYDIIVDKDAIEGYYDLSVGLCSDESCTGYKKIAFQLFVNTGGNAKLETLVEQYDALYPGSNGEVTVSIINKGALDIQYLIVEVEETDDYKILNPNRIYVGELESDDFETIDLNLHISEDLEDSADIKIPIKLEYSDINEKEYNEKQEVMFSVYTPQDLKKYNLVEKNNSAMNTVIIILILVLAVVGYFAWKRKHKK